MEHSRTDNIPLRCTRPKLTGGDCGFCMGGRRSGRDHCGYTLFANDINNNRDLTFTAQICSISKPQPIHASRVFAYNSRSKPVNFSLRTHHR